MFSPNLLCTVYVQTFHKLPTFPRYSHNNFTSLNLSKFCIWTVRKLNWWRYCLALCDEIFDNFDETLSHIELALQLRHRSHTAAKSTKTFLTVWFPSLTTGSDRVNSKPWNKKLSVPRGGIIQGGDEMPLATRKMCSEWRALIGQQVDCNIFVTILFNFCLFIRCFKGIQNC